MVPLNTTVGISAKVVASGGIGTTIAFIINDAEFLPLILSGLFASVTSYFYDWVHKHPRNTGLKEISELVKYCFYGVSVMFIIYYLGKEHGREFVSLPLTSWGFIAALCAGSAVTIVEWFSKILGIFIEKRIQK